MSRSIDVMADGFGIVLGGVKLLDGPAEQLFVVTIALAVFTLPITICT